MRKTLSESEAINNLLEYARMVISPDFAEDIAKAFQTSLIELGLSEQNHRLTNAPIKNPPMASGISTYTLAKMIAEKKGAPKITSGMYGAGSRAEDITKQSVDFLRSTKIEELQ